MRCNFDAGRHEHYYRLDSGQSCDSASKSASIVYTTYYCVERPTTLELIYVAGTQLEKLIRLDESSSFPGFFFKSLVRNCFFNPVFVQFFSHICQVWRGTVCPSLLLSL